MAATRRNLPTSASAELFTEIRTGEALREVQLFTAQTGGLTDITDIMDEQVCPVEARRAPTKAPSLRAAADGAVAPFF